MSQQEEFMREAIALSAKNITEKCWGPFGAVIVKDGEIIGRGYNHVVCDNDPTAHAEVLAIREACKKLWTRYLHGCELYTNCEPCPMCLGAAYRARLDKIYYANSEHDAQYIGFDDEKIYDEFAKSVDKRAVPMEQIDHAEAQKVFDEWKAKVNDIKY